LGAVYAEVQVLNGTEGKEPKAEGTPC